MNPLCIGLEIVLLGARFCFAGPQSPAVVTVPVCAVAVPRDRDFQRRLGAELGSTLPGSATESALSEWLSLRDQARACRKPAP